MLADPHYARNGFKGTGEPHLGPRAPVITCVVTCPRGCGCSFFFSYFI